MRFRGRLIIKFTDRIGSITLTADTDADGDVIYVYRIHLIFIRVTQNNQSYQISSSQPEFDECVGNNDFEQGN